MKEMKGLKGMKGFEIRIGGIGPYRNLRSKNTSNPS